MHKKLLALQALLCACLMWALVPAAALADELGDSAKQPISYSHSPQAYTAFLDAAPGTLAVETNSSSESCSPPHAIEFESGCCHLCPCSYAWAEGLILTRDNDSANRPLVGDLNTGDVLLSAGDLDFDWSGGLRVGYGRQICDCWAVELGYLGYYDQSASASVDDEDALRLPGALGLQVNNFFAADEVDVRYDSDLHSAEVNLVHCCAETGCSGGHSLEWLAGFRYFDLGERIGITAFDSAESTTEYNVRTENDLYGAQLGARARRCAGRWSWETTGKAGIYGNYMEQRQSPIVDFPDFEFRSARGASDSDVAFVGDLNVSSVYQMTRRWGVRAGYNLIWIEGVALAPDQLDFTNTNGSGRTLISDAGVFLHGVNVGLESRW